MVGGLAAAVELVLLLRTQARPLDSATAVINGLACVLVLLAGLSYWRAVGAPIWGRIALLCLVLGGLRSTADLSGGRSGWLLHQTITAGGKTVTSRSELVSAGFQAGEAPADLVNDAALNFNGGGAPDRRHVPLALSLETFVQGDGVLRIASSAPVVVTLGTQVLFDSNVPPDTPDGMVMTPNGPKSLDAIKAELRAAGYAGPQDDASIIFAYVRTALSGGWKVPFASPTEQRLRVDVAAQDLSGAALQAQLEAATGYVAPTSGRLQWLRRAAAAADPWLNVATLLLALVVVLASLSKRLRSRPRQWYAWLVVGLGAGLFYGLPTLTDWASQASRLAVLSAGDDWFTYESFARNIRAGSLLMLQGAPLGHAEAFYYQALYPYLLALEHFALGPSVKGPILMQSLAVVAASVLLAFTLPARMESLVALLLVIASGVMLEWFTLSTYLLSENALLMCLAVLLFLVSRLGERPAMRQLMLVGTVMGLAILSRSTAWLALPFVLAVVCWDTDRTVFGRRLAACGVPVLLLVMLIPARNWLAAGFPTPIPSSGSINIYQGLVPQGRTITTEPWLTWSKTYDSNVVASAEAVVNAPGQVGLKLANKALYVLGFPRTLASGDVPVVFFPVFLTWLLVLAGILTHRHSRLAWTALALGVSHAFTLVIFFPNNYYYRLLIPAMLPLAVWDALAIGSLLCGLPQPSKLGARLKRALIELELAEKLPRVKMEAG